MSARKQKVCDYMALSSHASLQLMLHKAPASAQLDAHYYYWDSELDAVAFVRCVCCSSTLAADPGRKRVQYMPRLTITLKTCT